MIRDLPRRAGTCLKAEHYQSAVEHAGPGTWFEVHAENTMGDGGPSHRWLDRVRRDSPLSLHGVGMSIGSERGLDPRHLDRLARAVERFQPSVVSEHLAWSSHGNIFFNDLLPLPYNRSTLRRVCDHIDQVQQRLGREILLENPSTYIWFEESTLSETEFLAEVARRSGCGLLLDVNNVYVSANNQGYAAKAYLDSFPLQRVSEIHLAGHAEEADVDGGRLLIDTHDREVCDAVWDLYRDTISRTGPIPTLIEWDANIPAWEVLLDQARLANRILDQSVEGANHAAAG